MSNFENKIGNRYGKLTVVSLVAERVASDGCKIWKCLCDCGNVTEVSSTSLVAGTTKSCGCLRATSKIINMVGMRFGRLTVRSFSHKNKHRDYFWFCDCDCGNSVVTRGTLLRRGDTVSCGCYQDEVRGAYSVTHNRSKDPIYFIYKGMLSRCLNSNNPCYKNYGGRGIAVCDRWCASFENFLADMGEIPKGYSLDRIDNNGPYSPDNCRWATRKQQSNNTRLTLFITYDGVIKPIGEWADDYNIFKETLKARIFKYKWPIEKALTFPVRKR